MEIRDTWRKITRVLMIVGLVIAYFVGKKAGTYTVRGDDYFKFMPFLVAFAISYVKFILVSACIYGFGVICGYLEVIGTRLVEIKQSITKLARTTEEVKATVKREESTVPQ